MLNLQLMLRFVRQLVAILMAATAAEPKFA